MTDLLAADAAARERALDPRASILLEAPAGSGKTTVLTQRILRLLACVDEPEEVLAITFTRKAAAEMRERVLRALGSAAAVAPGGAPALDSPPARRTQELALAARRHAAARDWGLERNPARLRIQTIDSLNHAIASQLPIAARAGGRLTVHDRAAPLHRLAARRALEDAEGVADLQADTALLFERFDNDWNRFERLLAEMLARRAHWLPLLLRGEERSLREIVEAGLEEVAAAALRRAAACIPAALLRAAAAFAPLHARRAAPDAARLLAAGGDWPADLGASPDCLPWWQCLASLTLTGKREWRRRLTVAEGFPPAEALARGAALDWIADLGGCAGAQSALAEIADLPPTRLERADAVALMALSRLLRFSAAELEVIFQEQGRVDHPYVAAAARRALTEEGEPTDLALRLGAGIRHVLIDEFQDTSAEQFELVRALTAGWEPGDGRTLFAVGDPMQSIYQFREAEVALFLRARDHGIGGVRLETLRLTRNFRSLPGLVEWNDATFARIFPREDDPRASAVAHAPSVAARSAAEPAVVALHRTPAGERDGEAALVVRLVADMRRRDPRGSIAILVSARQHATPITGALLAAGIPVSGVDLVPLAEVPVVRDLAALTRALEHRGDRTAWLSILRAPWCGLTLEELAPFAARGDPRSVWEALDDPELRTGLGPAARERLARLHAVLAPALAAAGRLPLAARVETTWLALGGPSACLDADEIVNAEAFLRALAGRPAEAAARGPLELDELLDALYASSASGAEDAVQVMTMHRAKGLEFDGVILPGLGRPPRHSAEPLLRWLDLPREREGSDLLLAPSPSSSRRGSEPVNQFLKRLQRVRGAHERVRLLYVACTRARRELHLIGQPSRRDPAQPQAGTLLAALWPALGDAFLEAPLGAAAAGPAIAAPRLLRRLPAGFRAPAPAPGPPFAGLRVANYEPAREVAIDWANETARHVGTAVHAALERLARQPALPAADEVVALAPSLRAALAALGVPADELAAATRRGLRALHTVLADPRGRWILDRTHRDAASELALSGILAGRLVSVVIDRSFVDAEGHRWVIDFKTSVPHGIEREAFLDAEVELYRAQLERYAALAGALGPEPVRAALYFPLLAELRECRLGDGSERTFLGE